MYNGFFYSGSEGALARDAHIQANTAASDARKAHSEVEMLTRRIDRMAMMTEALWLLLRDRFDVSEEDLVSIARDLDLSDGVLDGRVRRKSTACPACGRMVGARHEHCIYCRAEMPHAPFAGI